MVVRLGIKFQIQKNFLLKNLKLFFHGLPDPKVAVEKRSAIFISGGFYTIFLFFHSLWRLLWFPLQPWPSEISRFQDLTVGLLSTLRAHRSIPGHVLLLLHHWPYHPASHPGTLRPPGFPHLLRSLMCSLLGPISVSFLPLSGVFPQLYFLFNSAFSFDIYISNFQEFSVPSVLCVVCLSESLPACPFWVCVRVSEDMGDAWLGLVRCGGAWLQAHLQDTHVSSWLLRLGTLCSWLTALVSRAVDRGSGKASFRK